MTKVFLMLLVGEKPSEAIPVFATGNKELTAVAIRAMLEADDRVRALAKLRCVC